jgi:methylmalonyl-CoA carboxyltransferase 5S subunit
MPRTVEFTDLLLREAQQSLLETSIALADVAPVCEDLDNAGYWSVDCWGGTTLNSCVRFLNEAAYPPPLLSNRIPITARIIRGFGR